MELFPLGTENARHPAHPQKAVVDVLPHQGYKEKQQSFYTWLPRPFPAPGATRNAFASLMLPLQDWKGPGEIVRDQLHLTAPQVYVQQTPIPTGLAGIAAGQAALQSLMDNPYTLDGHLPEIGQTFNG